jgi:hypothetical protein
MKYLRSFALFWWDFVVGDDWRLVAGVVPGLGVTALLAHRDVAAWWAMPVVVALTLAWSLRRATGSR